MKNPIEFSSGKRISLDTLFSSKDNKSTPSIQLESVGVTGTVSLYEPLVETETQSDSAKFDLFEDIYEEIQDDLSDATFINSDTPYGITALLQLDILDLDQDAETGISLTLPSPAESGLEHALLSIDEEGMISLGNPTYVDKESNEITFTLTDSSASSIQKMFGAEATQLMPKAALLPKKSFKMMLFSWLGGSLFASGFKLVETLAMKRSLGFSRMLAPGVENWKPIKEKRNKKKEKLIPFERGMSGAEWKRFFTAQGPKLLMIPGTVGNDKIAFAGIGRLEEAHQKLWDTYNGNIICFNHYTLQDGLAANHAFLIELLKEARKAMGEEEEPLLLEVDVLTRSRGGLVLRYILQHKDQLQAETGIELKVNNAFSIAPPNLGTPLGNKNEIVQFLRRYALLVNLLPPSAVSSALKVLMSVVVAIAKGVSELPGIIIEGEEWLAANPDKVLQDKGGIRWGAGISDYTPDKKNPIIINFDKLIDWEFFDNKPNDFVVPVASAKGKQGDGFYIEDEEFLPFNEGTNHLEYVVFKNKKTAPKDVDVIRQIVDWLAKPYEDTPIDADA